MIRKKKDIPKQQIQVPPVEPVESPLLSEEANPAGSETVTQGADPQKSFPIVGIGASAGGLAAFEAFFSGMPADVDPGMAFVLVQHLAPNHKSILTDLIRRYTRMQVFEVEDGMTVQPNCTYIIPPNRDMAFLNGALQLLEPASPRGMRLPIDFFFRSLAQDQHERAICIVLSGTGSDGTLGVRAIKGEGGMVMAQNPASTEYDGMPRSAIGTGLVDYELPPAEMPAQLIAYAVHAFGRLSRPAAVTAPKVDNALKKIFILMRSQTSHDFSQYKPSTVTRRIERRMAVHQIATIEEYVKRLQQTPAEVEALFRDMLIGVTNFFRDPEAFKVLEDQVIPKLFASKPASTVIRLWVVGCSTGEEAYSLAILLAERQEAMKQSFQVQIFATDIDSQAIATARNGLYPASIAADISPERLKRFFTAEPDKNTFRIHKGIRDMLVFSEQNVIKDPPFSKLDLISCRNLLIYLSGDLQKKLMPLFHYALNPSSFLFLGTSETVGDFLDHFSALDRKQKLYQRRDDIHSAQSAITGRFLPPVSATMIDVGPVLLPRGAGKTDFPRKLPLREMAEHALLQQVVQAGALVDGNGDIFYLHGRTGLYLEPTPGETGINNILKMAREGLQYELTTALHKAVQTKSIMRYPGIRVKTNGDFTPVNLTIRPVAKDPDAKLDTQLYLVILEEASPAPIAMGQTDGKAEPAVPGSTEATELIKSLKQELRAKEEYLKTSHEELETSNEELKSSNEEMQSVNEELQSTNEELETSKEELQSVNEELATVNNELQTKVTDLSRTNNDMNNLLAGTGIATIFVDYNLLILRFTPSATQIINLILTDVGRPVAHVVSNLANYSTLVVDTRAVLDTLIPNEQEVQNLEGRWYKMRIQPYRTQDNVIEGAVITFVNVTEMKQTEMALQQTMTALKRSEERYRTVVEWSPHAVVVHRDGIILYANPAALKMFGATSGTGLTGMSILERIHPDCHQTVLALVQQVTSDGVSVPMIELKYLKLDGTVIFGEAQATNIIYDGAPAVHAAIQDITERKQADGGL
ncbi:MAG: chemotaxis protein CheB [Syntrophales bacterium]